MIPLGDWIKRSAGAAYGSPGDPQNFMPHLPKHFSLVMSVADSLRQSLAEGEWREFLPGERDLCTLLQISRQTLKAALLILKRQGLIKIAHGKRTRILHPPHVARRRSHVVNILLSSSMRRTSVIFTPWMTHLQQSLHSAGFEIRLCFDAHVGEQHSAGHLRALTHQTPAACWVLLSATHPTQKWFMEQEIPIFLVGSSYEGIRLPSLDLDFEAICRHAVGKLLALGHRRIALFMPEGSFAGFLVSVRGFMQGFQSPSQANAVPSVIRHNNTVEGVRHTLDSTFRRASAPTALIVAGPSEYAITTVGHLIQMGRRIPADISVVSRDYSRTLSAHVPSIAAYEYDADTFGTRLSRLVVKLARTGILTSRQHWVESHFREGSTIGPCRT